MAVTFEGYERRIDKVRVEILPSTENENEKTKKEKNKEDK